MLRILWRACRLPLGPAGVSFFLSVLWATSALGQGVTGPFNGLGSTTAQQQTYSTQGAVVQLKVLTGNKVRLDRQAVVKLYNKNTKDTLWQTTNDSAEAAFGDLTVGQYEIEVSAVGYLTAHKDFNVTSAIVTYNQEITLERDPTAVELNAPSESMPSKARKETQRAVSALKSGNNKEAQKRLEAAYKLVPDSADVNFLLGYLEVQSKDLEHAESYLRKASTLDPHNVQAPTLLGRIFLQKGEYEAARTSLEQAVAADPEYWMAHNLLASVYLHQHEYEKAAAQARLAMDKGKGAGNSAQLILGEALGNLGQNQAAIQALKAYLQDTPASPSAQQVRDLIAEIEKRPSNPSPNAGKAAEGKDQEAIRTLEAYLRDNPESPAAQQVRDTIAQLERNVATADDTTAMPPPKALSSVAGADAAINEPDLTVSIKTWEPLGVDETKPYVAADVVCPTQKVLDATGARVKQLVDDVSQIAAIEDLVHERVDELGNPVTKETRKFNYVVSISEPQPGWLSTEEYRTDQSGFTSFPDQIGTQGFTSLALVFHPVMRDNFQMICEGLGEWKGQAVWLVHFRQRDDRPNRIHSYKVGEIIYPVNLKGRAWITADKFQIVHMESDLVKSMPKIQLLTEHQVVDYGPVQFQKKNVELWLPKSAQIYFDFRKHRYVRRHSFDHYMLFAVDANEKQGTPKEAVATPDSKPPQPPQP